MEAQLLQPISEAQASDRACSNDHCPSAAPDDTGSPSQSAGAEQSDTETSDINFEETPVVPYVVGLTLTGTRHAPPEPFGWRYTTENPPMVENCDSLSQAELCCMRLPLGGQTIQDDQITLTITDIIRAGFNTGAQLVVVNETMVAKIFDPLCYRDYDYDIGSINVVYDADGDYSREAAAYEQLQKSSAAREVTPAFYGTWTIPVDTQLRDGDQLQKHTRQVPLVLMEYVRGDTMRNVDARALTEQIRSCILEKVIDNDIVIFHAGIDNPDTSPRNIIIAGLQANPEDNVPDGITVKEIDFNIATVRRHPGCHNYQMVREVDEERAVWLPKLQSPMIRWFSGMEDFAGDGWCPGEEGEPELWLWEQYHNDERYIPVIWDPSQPDARPQRVEFESGSETGVDSGLGLDMVVEKGEEGGKESSVEVPDHSVSAVQVS